MVSYNRSFTIIILVSLFSPALVIDDSGDELNDEDFSVMGESCSQYKLYREDLHGLSVYSRCCKEMRQLSGEDDPEAIDFARAAMRDWRRGEVYNMRGKLLKDYYDIFETFLDPTSVDPVEVWCKNMEKELKEDGKDTAGTSSQESTALFDEPEQEPEPKKPKGSSHWWTPFSKLIRGAVPCHHSGDHRSTIENNEPVSDTAGTSSQENTAVFDAKLCKDDLFLFGVDSGQSLQWAFYNATLEEYSNNHWKYEDYIRVGVTPRRNYRYEYMVYLINSFSLIRGVQKPSLYCLRYKY